MEKEIFNTVLLVRLGVYNVPEATNIILSLMCENEIGVSDAPERKHGGLHDVRECNASDLPDTDGEHTNGATLETRIEDENPKQKLVNLQTYENDKKREHIIKQVIDTTKSF